MRPHPRFLVGSTLVFSCWFGSLACSTGTQTSAPPPSGSTSGSGATSSASGGPPSTGSGGTSGAATGVTSSGSGADSASASTGVGGMGEPPPATPGGHLHLTTERLAELKALAALHDPAFESLRTLADGHLSGNRDLWHDSPENFALLYLLTGETKYAAAAYAWEKELIDGVDVRFDSYLDFGDLMRHAALVLDWCRDVLDANQRKVLVDYLTTWTEELWFANKGSGWGLGDPGNNYHHAFLQGTAYAGYALKLAGSSSAEKYLGVLHDRLDKPGGVFDYLANQLPGGDWREGANYGERSKQRLFDALAVVASMGGGNAFAERPYFAQSIAFALYQLQPGKKALAPAGDLARDSAMEVTASERDYLATAAAWMGDGRARRMARWYLDNAAPAYDNPYAGLRWKELVFRVPGPALEVGTLPLSYLAEGTGFLNWRSGWDAGATSVTLSGARVLEQSHQHHDVGSFVLWKRGWLGMDATTLSKSGLDWSPGAHSGIHVPGAERRTGSVAGLLRHEDAGTLAYAAIDATAQYRAASGGKESMLMKEVTREVVYVRPGLILTYDRVAANDPARVIEWRLHVPKAPSSGSSVSVTANGASLVLVPVVPSSVSLASDADLEGGASTATRIVEAASGANLRFSNAIAVSDGAPSALLATRPATTGAVDAIDTGSVVAVFSANAFGAPAELPFSYTLSGVGVRTHVLANVSGDVAVAVVKSGGVTKVTVSPGATHHASGAGLIRFVE